MFQHTAITPVTTSRRSVGVPSDSSAEVSLVRHSLRKLRRKLKSSKAQRGAPASACLGIFVHCSVTFLPGEAPKSARRDSSRVRSAARGPRRHVISILTGKRTLHRSVLSRLLLLRSSIRSHYRSDPVRVRSTGDERGAPRRLRPARRACRRGGAGSAAPPRAPAAMPRAHGRYSWSRRPPDAYRWIPFGGHPLKLERYRED
jgi:hypothetical protein